MSAANWCLLKISTDLHNIDLWSFCPKIAYQLHMPGRLSLSLHFNGHFPVGPGLAGTRMYFIGAKDDGGGGDNWSCKMRKSPVRWWLPTNQRPAFLQAGCPSCCPTNSVRALKGRETKIGVSASFRCTLMTGFGQMNGWQHSVVPLSARGRAIL